jgi:membrane protease YdiL (CAAX protease family)
MIVYNYCKSSLISFSNNFENRIDYYKNCPDKVSKATNGALCYLVTLVAQGAILFLAEKAGLCPSLKLFTAPLQNFRRLTGFEKFVSFIAIFPVNGVTCVVFPIIMEIVFREVIQRDLLKERLGSLLERISPKLKDLKQSNKMTVARIAVTSCLYSAYHIRNYALMSREQLIFQLIQTTIFSIGAGYVRETEDLFTATTMHGYQNLLGSLIYQGRLLTA